MSSVIRTLKRSALLAVSATAIYIGLLIFPGLLFAHQTTYKNFNVYSDRQIDPNVKVVLEDVLARLEHSELYSNEVSFNVYLCNDQWRFNLFTRNPNAGGQVNFLISSNIFIRESDVATNQLIPPNGWMFEMDTRPLSYFIAHESVHALQRAHDPFMVIHTPNHIIEGYADYIAKRPDFDFNQYTQLLRDADSSMDPKNGLYKRYHLYSAILIDSLNLSFKDVLRTEPELEKTLEFCKN